MIRIAKLVMHHSIVVSGALVLTLAFFMVLPLMQSISKPPTFDTIYTETGIAEPPPPPTVDEDEPEDEPEQEEEPPEMEPEPEMLDLSQLEMALNPGGFGEGTLSGDFSVDVSSLVKEGGGLGDLFSTSDLDVPPRVIYQASPSMTPKLRRQAPAKVIVIFIVDERGRVQSPKAKSSSQALFEKPAIDAVKKWRFEPGKRQGKPVRFRMEVPITFPGG